MISALTDADTLPIDGVGNKDLHGDIRRGLNTDVSQTRLKVLLCGLHGATRLRFPAAIAESPLHSRKNRNDVELVTVAEMGDAEYLSALTILASRHRDAVAAFQHMIEGLPLDAIRHTRRCYGE